MDGPVEIQKWLHVWTEAERARRLNKKPCAEAPVNDAGEGHPMVAEERGGGDGITRLPRIRLAATRDE